MQTTVSDWNVNGGMNVRVSNPRRPVRNKSLPRNHFRGVTKDVLQRQTSMYIAAMTVSFLLKAFPKFNSNMYFQKSVSNFLLKSRYSFYNSFKPLATKY